MNHYSRFLPGEGGYLLELLQDVSFYYKWTFIISSI